MGSWQDVESRRRLFETYAKDNNFNPFNPHNWYQQPRKKILSVKACYNCFTLLIKLKLF